jgi:hypothetical protein
MSMIYQWPIAFVKHWVLPLSYAIGFTYDGRLVYPIRQTFEANLVRGRIAAITWFPEPVKEVHAFSRFIFNYSGPLIVEFDYPALGMFLDIRIEP